VILKLNTNYERRFCKGGHGNWIIVVIVCVCSPLKKWVRVGSDRCRARSSDHCPVRRHFSRWTARAQWGTSKIELRLDRKKNVYSVRPIRRTMTRRDITYPPPGPQDGFSSSFPLYPVIALFGNIANGRLFIFDFLGHPTTDVHLLPAPIKRIAAAYVSTVRFYTTRYVQIQQVGIKIRPCRRIVPNSGKTRRRVTIGYTNRVYLARVSRDNIDIGDRSCQHTTDGVVTAAILF